MRTRRSLTARGAGALIAALGCLIAANVAGARILLYIGVLLAVLTLLSLLAVRLPRRSGTVTRQISTDLLTVSETSRVTVRFTLRSLRIPATVIHGMQDRMVHVSGGRSTAQAIPGAELLLIPGMGHDLPPALFETFRDAIRRTADRS